ncbi:MAG: choice-of-anchor D domain-containing protein [Natrialbaceae archaeon]|nr:choice-of-anchor D domain-containing protein [Natrialbaceae archaeon]
MARRLPGPLANHTYAAVGTYAVALTVTDGAGNTNTTTQSVTVTGGPEIDVAPTSLAFGSVPVGNATTATVTISNQGQQPLAVTGGTITGAAAGEFNTSVGSFVLPVGDTQNETVTFAPGSGGTKSATLEITSNDTTTPTATVALSGSSPTTGGHGGIWGGSAGTDDSSTDPPETVVNVTRSGDQVMITVEHARAGVPINASLGPVHAFDLSWLNVTPNVSGEFTLSITVSETEPANTTVVLGDNETALGYVTIEHSIPDSDIDGVQFAVAVNKSYLAAAGIDPGTLTLSRMVNGTPVALPTHLDPTRQLRSTGPGPLAGPVGLRGLGRIARDGTASAGPRARAASGARGRPSGGPRTGGLRGRR